MSRGIPLRMFILPVVSVTALAQGIITTVAGTDRFFPQTSMPALEAPLIDVRHLAVDAKGNLYFPDWELQMVMRVSPDGVLTVVAGNGQRTYSGEGGPAVNAALFYPNGIAVDRNGALFVADSNNHRIRRVGPDGIITTFAGNGRGDYGGDGGPATAASLSFPNAVAMDAAGNLFIADSVNRRVRKVTPDGRISTVAGNGRYEDSGDGGPATAAGIRYPAALAVDSGGKLYISDKDSFCVRVVSAAGSITTVAGNRVSGFSGDGGPALQASLTAPLGLALDAEGNLFISGGAGARVRRVGTNGIITTVAGRTGQSEFSGDGGPAVQAGLAVPRGLAVDAQGNLYIGDSGNRRIRRVDRAGIISTVAGSGEGGYSGDGEPAGAALLYAPRGLALDLSGALIIADSSNNRIRKVGADGIMTTVAGNYTTGGPIDFTGDGGPASMAALRSPSAVIFDRAGDLYIAERNRGVVRKVSSDGIIRTIAGGGSSLRDGIPANQGRLSLPMGVAVDRTGSVFISDGTHRVRRVTPDGIITTVAGTGEEGYSGDGAPGIEARLNSPQGLAFDPAGNLLIADSLNHRVRKLSPQGIISTAAGTGESGFSGDGGPATRARLSAPQAVAADGTGVLWIVDKDNLRVRRVGLDGIIQTIAGAGGPASFSGDGGPPTKAQLYYPEGIAVDPTGNVFIADTSSNRVRVVLAAPAAFEVAPANLSFTASPQAPRPVASTLELSSSIPGLSFTAAATTRSGGEWLKLSAAAGILPAILAIKVDAERLSVGSYEGTVTITVPLASPSSRVLPVRLLVSVPLAAPFPGAPQLGVETSRLSFSFVRGSAPASAELSVTNRGGGSLPFTVSATTSDGLGWLAVSPAGGRTPASLTVTVTPGQIEPGTYSGALTITALAEQLEVPVMMTISPARPMILLSQSGLSFIAVAQGGAPLPQNFGVLNVGEGTMPWTARASTLSGGAGWLAVTPTSGAATANSLQIPLLDVSVNPAELAPGEYYGRVEVVSAEADNSPQIVSVLLNVLPPGSDPGPEVRPSGLIFVGPEGSNPGSQDVFLSNLRLKPATYASGRLTFDGQDWFTHLPAKATLIPNQLARIVVQPLFEGLQPGVRQGVLTLQFEDRTIRNVSVLAVVAPAGTTSGAHYAAACRGQGLQVEITSLQKPQFTAVLGQAVPIEARVVDECGNPLVPEPGRAAALVVARFSNQDRQIELHHIGGGVWRNSWTPGNASSAPVTVSVVALYVSGNVRQAGDATLTGTLQSVSRTPMVAPGAVLNAAGGASWTVVSPGTLISIYGRQLAEATAAAPAMPLGTDLGGTEVVIGGRPLPLLYASDRQLNAQVPYDLTVNTRHQIVVRRGSTLSVPEQITVAPAQPAVFTRDMTGTGQGAIVSADNTLAEPGSPVRPGDVVVIYCTGLGAVAPRMEAGKPAPREPLSQTVNPVTVTMGGRPAQVLFAGLTPGYAGLYQVNAIVPQNISGDSVSVVVTVAGQSSPPVTMAVR